MSSPMLAEVSTPAPISPDADRLDAAYRAVEDEVRRADKDRWLTGLYAPAERRRHLHALWAFACEIGRIRDVVSDPLPGEIRARWWADMLEGARGEEGEAHPIAACLLDTCRRFDLPVADLVRYVDARIFDLYDDPMPDGAALDAYCRETTATLLRLGARVLIGSADAAADHAAEHAGLALGLTGLLRAVPFHASRGQIFLPQDALDRHGVAREAILTGRSSAGLKALLGELRGRARGEAETARRLLAEAPGAAAPVFLPLALVDLCLDRMDRPDYEPFLTPVTVPQWRRQWRLWRFARRYGG